MQVSAKYLGRLLHLFAVIFFILVTFCCSVREAAHVPLTASFTYSPVSPEAGQAVQFTDTSTGSPTAWVWHFGDGMTSVAQNPSHTYGTASSYNVTLEVSIGSSTTSVSRTVTVLSASTLAASFTYSPATPVPGQAVQFTDTSTGMPTSWEWDFGDGTSSTTRNPSHTYAAAGSYTVTLTIGGGSRSDDTSRTIIVGQSLTASFIYSPASPVAGQAVQFTDTSTGNPTSWQWSFGDGATSTAQNPSHAYTTVSSYNVTLKVSKDSSTTSVSRTVTVLPASTLAASFTYSPASPAAGQPVQFTDTSTGAQTSWQWDFGDGTSSTTPNPNHTYAVTGSYTVTLTIWAGSSSDSTNQTISIRQPGTITAASPSYADVSAAISSASPGDTVIVPAGAATWSSRMVITKGIYLIGAGIGQTVITNGQSGTLITYNPSNYSLNSPFRFSGFSFNMASKGKWFALGQANKTPPFTIQDKIRIDHNRVYNCARGVQFWNYCDMFGVVDNNSFEGVGYFAKADTQGSENWWSTSPQKIYAPGTNNYLYFEDNTIIMAGTDNLLQEQAWSGRYAWRYNTITGAKSYSLFEFHGTQSGGMGSGFGAEVYGNDINWGSFEAGTMYKTRGGVGLVFYNNNIASETVDNVAYASLFVCSSISPCLQIVHDNYWFNNRHKITGAYLPTSVSPGRVPCCGYTSTPVGGRDVMSESTIPAFVTSGTLANRPTNPVVHQGYWATDQSTTDLTGMVGVNPITPIFGTLYVCRTAGVWEEFYKPYTYPHPLRTLLSMQGTDER